MLNTFKEILNIRINNRYNSEGVDEHIIKYFDEYKHVAEMEQEERKAFVQTEIRKRAQEETDKKKREALVRIYGALLFLENPARCFGDESIWAEAERGKDNFEKVVEVEEIKNEVVEVETEEESKGTIEIIEEHGLVKANFKYDKDFIQLVKSLGFQWDGDTWTCKRFANVETAYLINEMLKNGYQVLTSNHDALDLIKKNKLENATGRYITLKNDKTLEIAWRGRENEVYQDARAIPGSKYKHETRVIEVETKRINEVIELARNHNFRFINCKKQLEKLRNDKVIINPVTKDDLSKEELFEVLPDLIEE